MSALYHHTDTARLPWILRSGELQPGRNRIGGYPDPDFIWATTDPRGDTTASADRGYHFRSGKVRHVRFTLDAAEFFPWSSAPQIFPQWKPEHIKSLEAVARDRGVNPLQWFCRATALRLTPDIRIDTRSYQNNRWTPLEQPTEVMAAEDGWLCMPFGQRLFASRQVDMPQGAVGYEVRTSL